MSQKIELLAPARDVASARAAILCGADAVYLGAERFSARQAAANTLDDIAAVIQMAHPFHVRVYAAVNTLLYDDELADAQRLIWQLYERGIDGVIIQDMGLLEVDLPPVPLIASTQMHNNTPEKVKFLQDVGFQRVILARELTLAQIRQIRQQTSLELECFVHGALCVCQSGRCAASFALGGRSGNRGQCAQPCRLAYNLKTEDGKILCRDKHLLSLKDLNLSDDLDALLDAGISSFKIEGRLKDAAYVANVVAFYRQKLDAILPRRSLAKSSSGIITLHFQPDAERVFNRGFTRYGLADKKEKLAAIDTPKSVGKRLGVVQKISGKTIHIDTTEPLHAGDGLCWFDSQKRLCGSAVQRVDGARVALSDTIGLAVGAEIFRNDDTQFIKRLLAVPATRKIPVRLTVSLSENGLTLSGVDEDGCTASATLPDPLPPADKPQQALDTLRRQLTKLGDTIYQCAAFRLDVAAPPFVPVAALNDLRRRWVEQMTAVRLAAMPRQTGGVIKNDVPYPQKELDFRDNVLNAKAAAFYRRHGVQRIEPAAESGLDLRGKTVMTTRYCIRHQLGLCEPNAAPLILELPDGRRFRARFRCSDCGMELDWIQ